MAHLPSQLLKADSRNLSPTQMASSLHLVELVGQEMLLGFGQTTEQSEQVGFVLKLNLCSDDRNIGRFSDDRRALFSKGLEDKSTVGSAASLQYEAEGPDL